MMIFGRTFFYRLWCHSLSKLIKIQWSAWLYWFRWNAILVIDHALLHFNYNGYAITTGFIFLGGLCGRRCDLWTTKLLSKFTLKVQIYCCKTWLKCLPKWRWHREFSLHFFISPLVGCKRVGCVIINKRALCARWSRLFSFMSFTLFKT